jgi:NADPH-dependent 2,4-dienoyl-CoA reductase/sulfur reductase-like enzyme
VDGAYDVVVCGGGPSGFIGAIAAARQGAKVALIERYGFLAAWPPPSGRPDQRVLLHGEVVVGGIPWEFAKRLEEMGGASIEYPLGSVALSRRPTNCWRSGWRLRRG